MGINDGSGSCESTARHLTRMRQQPAHRSDSAGQAAPAMAADQLTAIEESRWPNPMHAVLPPPCRNLFDCLSCDHLLPRFCQG